MNNTVKRTMKKWKLKWLHTWAYIKKHVGSWISYAIMFMCVGLFILALGSNIAHRLPVLSFLAKEMKLPFVFDTFGKVYIYNNDDEIAIPVTIYIGGYSIDTMSGEQYDIKFTATNREHIPIVICFTYEGEEYTEIEYLDYRDKYSLTCAYEYHLGE